MIGINLIAGLKICRLLSRPSNPIIELEAGEPAALAS
jgi:hypothetical protein